MSHTRRTLVPLIATVCLWATSCGAPAGGPQPDTTVGSEDASHGEADTSGADAPDSSADAGSDSATATDGLSVGASEGSYDLPFTIGIEGSGSGRVGAISLRGGAGTIVLDGESLPTAVYERQQWDAFGYTLFQALAVSDDALSVMWFYCSGTALTNVWVESTDGHALEVFTASGTCDEAAATARVDVAFPPLELPIPALVQGFTVTGPTVAIRDGQRGSLEVAPSEFEVFPFGYVDCTIECGMPGWHELHALLWDAERRWLCFAIFYLFMDDRPPLLAYSFSLPTLQAPFGTQELIGATWEGP